MCVYPVVADYVYPDVSGWSVGVTPMTRRVVRPGYTVIALE